MLYVFECMFAMFVGDANYILASTGQAVAGKDIAVGFFAYLSITSLIVGIGNLIPFLLYNRDSKRQYFGLKKVSRKCFLIISIIFFALCPISIIINIFLCYFA